MPGQPQLARPVGWRVHPDRDRGRGNRSYLVHLPLDGIKVLWVGIRPYFFRVQRCSFPVGASVQLGQFGVLYGVPRISACRLLDPLFLYLFVCCKTMYTPLLVSLT